MAKPPDRKSDAAKPAEIRVLPMELKLGDRPADERAEWRVIGRPYTTAGGKYAHVGVQGAATEAECWASFAGLQLTGVDADVVRTVIDGHKTTAYYRDGTKYVVEFTCLADTLDPRGAKAK